MQLIQAFQIELPPPLSLRQSLLQITHGIRIRRINQWMAEENYKAIWKDFPLLPFSFNRTIIIFVIKYHLSSRLHLYETEGEGELLSVYRDICFWYAARSSVSRSVGEYDSLRIAFHFIFFCASIFVFCIHFHDVYGVDFFTCIDSNGSVCVWIFNNDTTAQFYGDEQNAMGDKKKRKRSLTVVHLYIHMYTQTSSIYVYARAVIQV